MKTEGVCFTISAQTEKKWMEAKERTGRVFGKSPRPLLLFFGMFDKTDGLDMMNPAGLRRGGFTAARNLLVDGVSIKVPSQKNMLKADKSPFEFDGKEISDSISGEKLVALQPKYDLSTAQLKTIAATPEGAVEAMTFTGCNNVDMGMKCSFCRIGKAAGKIPVIPEQVAGEVLSLVIMGVPVRMAVLNTGQMENGQEIVPLAATAAAIKRVDDIKVSAEVWPGSLPADLGSLKSKIDVFQVNIELASDSARALLCPGKPGEGEYFKAFGRLVREGFQVSSVMQTNYYLELEPIGKAVETAQRMLALGVVPEMVVSRGIIGSSVKDGFWDKETSFEENLARYDLWLSRMEKIANSVGQGILAATAGISGGCAKCGMCSVNGDFLASK